MTKFKYKGEDAYPSIDKWIKNDAEKYWKTWCEKQVNPFDIQMSPAAIDMYKAYGLFPVGDTVRGGTWKYHWNLETKKKWYGPLAGPDSEIGWETYLNMLSTILTSLASAVGNPAPLTTVFPPKPSLESVVPLIDSLINDREGVYQVNVPNNGVISSLPDDVAVEIPVKIDGKRRSQDAG